MHNCILPQAKSKIMAITQLLDRIRLKCFKTFHSECFFIYSAFFCLSEIKRLKFIFKKNDLYPMKNYNKFCCHHQLQNLTHFLVYLVLFSSTEAENKNHIFCINSGMMRCGLVFIIKAICFSQQMFFLTPCISIHLALQS